MNEKISVTLTHYRRLDLLDQTIESFLKTNQYPIDEFFIIDDSGDKYYSTYIADKYKDIATVISNEHNIGQRKSLDIIFNACKNEYIFHLEEDWLFDAPPSSYIKDSIIILRNNPDIHQVHIRHHSDNPHCVVGCVYAIDGVQFRFMDPDFMGVWNGFSFNPGLRRRSDILKMFPNGLIEFKDEMQAALHTRKFNYKAVCLENTVCKHIGWHARTQINGRGI